MNHKCTCPKTAVMIVAVAMLSLLAACRGNDRVESRQLFSLDIGRMEDQLDLVQYVNRPYRNEFGIALKSGMISITDALSRKVMIFNSYGDLVTLVYNESTNPAPVMLVSDRDKGVVVSKRAVAYPFLYTGKIAVAPDGGFFVEDYAPESERIKDEETGSVQSSYIRKFSQGGEYLATVGQEGPDGTPFPHIEDIFVTNDNHLVVVCRRSVLDWTVFGFDSRGANLYSVRIVSEDLPLSDGSQYASLTRIVTGKRGLILKVDYYGNNPEGSDPDDIVFTGSSLLLYSTATESVYRTIELPDVRETVRGSAQARTTEVTYELLGAADGFSYCIAPIADSLYRLLIVPSEGDTVHIGTIELEDEEALMRTFYVGFDGILVALVAEPLVAKVYLWRYDSVLDGLRSQVDS